MGIARRPGAMTARAVFVDRDGTINRDTRRNGRSYPPQTLEEFELLPGVVGALTALKDAGFMLVVVTNQPDVGAGRQARAVVEAMHGRLRSLVPIDDVRVCYHVDADDCACRKPRPGMLLAAAADLDVDLPTSYMIGDRWRDVGAGRAAGCRTIFIRNDFAEAQPTDHDLAVGSLAEASEAILGRRV